MTQRSAQCKTTTAEVTREEPGLAQRQESKPSFQNCGTVTNQTKVFVGDISPSEK